MMTTGNGYKRHQMLILLWMLTIVVLFSQISHANIGSSNSDLCYLSDGGSSQTFTVNEATPINSVIGSLQVIGNISSDGDVNSEIELSLAPNHSHSRLEGGEVPIRIEPGTKQLVLTRKLDKEAIEGEHGIIVGIRCKKLAPSNDPSIIIPVRIIVTDANDHAPEFVGTPYIVNVSEVALIGSSLVAASRIRAVDGDQQGPFSTVEYFVEPGPFSHLLRFQSRLGGDLVLAAPLDFETLPKFWVTLRAQDQGEPPLSATTILTVMVQDADDQNPRFIDDKYSAILPEIQRENQPLIIKPKQIRAIDPDTEINSPIEYMFNFASKEYSYFTIDSKYAAIKLKRPLSASINLPITLVIRATQTDNRDRYALTTLTIFGRRESSREAELTFHRANYNVSVPENVPLGQVLLTVTVDGRDESGEATTSARGGHNASGHDNVEGKVIYQLLDDEEGNFDIRSNGEIVVHKALDYEQRPWYSFRVMASDGKQSDVTRVNVTLVNVNDHDPQFSQAHYNFFVSESKLLSRSPIGEIKATDKDIGDTLEFNIKGPFSKVFSVDKQGKLRVRSIKNLNVTQCHLIVVASDSGSPPRSSSVPVTVQFTPSVIKTTGRSLIGEGLLESASSEIDMIGHRASGVNISSLFNVTGSSAILLVIVLGILLATLFIIIITLTVHLFRHRKISESSGMSSASTDSCSSSTDSCNRGVGGGGVNSSMLSGRDGLSPRKGGLKSFSFSSLAKKSCKVGVAPDGRNLFGISSKVAEVGMHGVENPIFNLPASLPNNLTSRYYSHPGGSPPPPPPPPNSSCNKSDPDSAIVSDASSAETCNGSVGQQNHHNLNVHHHLSHSHQQIRCSPDSMVDLTCKHSHHSVGNGCSGEENGSRTSSGSLSPPPPPSITCTGTMGGGTASRISVIKWPQGSIPRRVKKLTWEDERLGYNTIINYGNIDRHSKHSDGRSLDTDPSYDYSDSYSRSLDANCNGGFKSTESTTRDHMGTELDPDVSVAPYRRANGYFNSHVHGLNSMESKSNLPDLTVYF